MSSGFEGIFGAILGAVAGFVVRGLSAEVTRVYKAMILSVQKIPATRNSRLFLKYSSREPSQFLEETFADNQ